MKGRNKQSALGINGNSEIYVGEVSHGVAVQKMSVECLMLGVGQRTGNGIKNDVVEGDVGKSHSLGIGFYLLAVSHDLGGVEGGGMGELSSGGQRGYHLFGNGLADGGHLLVDILGNRSCVGLCGGSG